MDGALDILLIEDNRGDTALLEESLSGEMRVRLSKAERLAEGIALARPVHRAGHRRRDRGPLRPAPEVRSGQG